MADIKVSWLAFDVGSEPADVRVSWLALDTAAEPVDVKVSWIAFDTAATPVDVKVSWVAFDTAAAVEDTRRPKSTNTLKLQRIKEGRATALSAKALTHAHPAQGKGESPTPVTLISPGQGRCVSARAGTVSQPLRARGSASASAAGRLSHTRGQVASTGAGARVTCHAAHARGIAHCDTAQGAARVSLRSFVSFSNYGQVTARGATNLSVAELVAVTRVIIDRRR